MPEVIVDYSTARPSVSTLKGLGAVGVMRYLSTPDDSPKNLTVSEATRLLEGGLGIGLVFEEYAGRPKEGAAAGIVDARAAETLADKLGAPKTVPIFMAIDYDTSRPAEVEAYLKAASEQLVRPRGVYGEDSIVDYFVGRYGFTYGWQTIAWSGGRVSPEAHLLQNKFDGDWDRNDVLRPFPLWGKGMDPTPLPTGVRIPVDDGRRTKVIAGGRITTGFGVKGKTWQAGYHPGDDWNGPGEDYGMPALSPVEGKVIAARKNAWPIDAYGNQVVIEDALGFRTALCHLARITVTVGQKVYAGQQVGTVGATGRAYGAHVHIERRRPPFGYWQHERPQYHYPKPSSKTVVVDELVKGSRCASVYWVQRALNRLAIGGAKLPLTGYFGDATLALVKAFQTGRDDVGDGLLGPKQTARLLELTNLTDVKVEA